MPASKVRGCMTVVVACAGGLIAAWLLGAFVLWLFMGGGLR